MLDNARALGETLLGARLVDLDWSIAFMLGLFLVFAFLLTKLITRPMMQSQEQRYASMEGARDAAAQAEIVAAETQLAYEKQHTVARQSAVEVRDQIREAAVATARTTVEKVRAEVTAEVASSNDELAAAAAKARAEMKPHVEQLATALSVKLVKQTGGKA
ncbi:MAG: hypothetical protein CVU56_13455 [Deltaproteobacteria bacterium HGW-Deltaproteobacteria-14]|jgi:F0F1-type ATP synthase membrane subunit b/b'|nr:MAG: hypothetical protein CVU56_13455 [Deltaproteobacteria bacterium HGW-Deltaproteobacteria-14]